tara:strand:- start:47963 stop:48742 length:780 start_codon:yes stop_codon:yes gene_type:complete
MAATEIALDELVECVADDASGASGPKYVRLFEAFSDCVISGRFKPGERVPTETELARNLPYSVGTVQKALAQLVSNGLIVRHRRTGTFIAERRSQANKVFVYRFRDPATGKMMLPFVRTLAVTVDESDGPWRRALNVKRMVRVDRLVWFDQQPPAFSSVYFSYAHGKDYLDEPIANLHGSSLHAMMIERFNLPTVRMEHSIGCMELADDACEHLILPSGTMGMVWDIKDFSFQDTPILFQRYQLPPGHRPIEITESYGA